jgi:hypothetical protein
MLTERLMDAEVFQTIKEAVYCLAQAQGATVTTTRKDGHLEVWVSLPDGKEYNFGHTGFGASTKHGTLTEFDVWHDVLVGITYPVIDSEEDDEEDFICEDCKHGSER